MPQGRRDIKRLRGWSALAVALLMAACSSASSGDTDLVQLTSEPRPEAALDEALSTSSGSGNAGSSANGRGSVDATTPPVEVTDATSSTDVTPVSDVAGSEGDTLSEADMAAPNDSMSDEDSSGPEPEDTDQLSNDSDDMPSDTSDGGSVSPELCAPGTTSCEGQSVMVCAPSGEEWTVVATCPDDQPCLNGACCDPNCEGKSCGDDGCGGSCGSCDAGWVCGAEGLCVEPPPCTEGEACDDGDPCTAEGLCIDGGCIAEPLKCDDGDPCTSDSCGAQGCAHKPLVCDDGDACTEDQCAEGECVFSLTNCDDGDPCTTDSCGSQGCINAPLNCDDGDPCTDDSCSDAGCVNGPVNCDDGDPCTEDSCSSQGCINAPLSCDDGDPCTSDACGAQGCTFTPLDCDDGEACTEDSCGTEGCVNVASECDDGDPCTDDTCGDAGCVYLPKDCNDAKTCTVNSCVDGACQAEVVDGTCLIDDTCTPEGAASPENPCLRCAPNKSQTTYTPTGNVPCDDGDLCTSSDTCQIQNDGSAVCKGVSLVPESDNPCVDLVCVDGEITDKEVNGASCAPEDPCATEGACLDGLCVAQDPCECYVDEECALNEVCEDFACTTTFCGNGVCDPGDDAACPEDCEACQEANWCMGICTDPITANPACSQDCCGDGFCALNESAACCPEDCAPATACDDAPVVGEVPVIIQGNTNGSNAVVSADPFTCGDGDAGLGFGYGDGREDLVRFIAPFTGTFLFQLDGDWNSQMWFFESCDAPAKTCIETGPNITGAGSIVELEMTSGEAIVVVIDSISIYFGSGPYTLTIDGLCTPQCQGKSCGDDGCGGSCGTCNGGNVCNALGQCLNAQEVCDYHLDCAGNEVCGYWPGDELNRCSAICKGPKNCFAGQICERVPGSAHIAFCRDKTDTLDIGEPCTSPESCDSGLCVQGACREACITQKGCQSGDVCRRVASETTLSAACVPAAGGLEGDACGSCASEHCDLLNTDEGPLCADLCVTPSDCTGDQTCYFVDQSGGINASTVPYFTTYPDPLNDALMGCYTIEGGLGASPDGTPCVANSECQSGRCLPIGAQGSYLCSRPCYKNSDCSGDMSCFLTGTNLVGEYLSETGMSDPGAYSLVRICVF